MTQNETPCPAMLEGVLGTIDTGVIVLDHEGRIVLWNRWMERHAFLSSSEVLGRALLAVFPDLAGKRIASAVQHALRDNFTSVLSQTLHKAPFALFESPATRAAGERIQQAVAVNPLDLAGAPRHCVIQVSDVSVAVHRERLLRDQAVELRSQTFSDGLTGIANRRHFDVALEKEIRRVKRSGTPLTLLMIDIDCFKLYNDHYGHQQGDDTLIKVANALAAMLHRPLDLIARYGGEEFAVILPELGEEQCSNMAEAMREQIEALAIPHAKSTNATTVTVSIGMATRTSESPVEGSALIGAADRALYRAKGAGRNRVVRITP